MKYNYTDKGRKHLHSLEGKPLLGTSSIVRIIGKGDALLQWGVDCGADYIHEKIIQFGGTGTVLESLPQWLLDSRSAWKTKRDASAEVGTLRHGVLETYIKDCMTNNGGAPIPVLDSEVQVFVDWALNNVKKFLFVERHVFSEEMWTGGILDLIFEDKDGAICLADHKSSKKAYLSQWIQIAGYDLQQRENGLYTPEGRQVSEPLDITRYYVFPFRSVPFAPEVRVNLDELREGFKSALRLYKLENN